MRLDPLPDAMNKLQGRITAIESNDHVSLVDVVVNGDMFTATLLETPAEAAYLCVGNPVQVWFKETEVSLAKDLEGMISLRNRFHAIVKEVRCGKILGEVVLDYQGVEICSIITTRSIQRMAIRVGEKLEALVKANEMTLLAVEA